MFSTIPTAQVYTAGLIGEVKKRRAVQIIKKIAVVYATRSGTTKEIAETVQKVLGESGYSVDCFSAREKIPFGGYDGIVFGSPVRIGKLMPELLRCIRKNRSVLKGKIVAAFAVCLLLKDDTPENRTTAASYLEPVRGLLPLVSETVFAGAVSFVHQNVFVKFIFQKMAKMEEHDYRDSQKITEWTLQLAKLFQ